MGNSLTVNKNTNMMDMKEASTLDKYINDFFANSSNDLVNIKDLNKDVNTTARQLEPLFKRHLKARACCLQQEYIPVALPYVYPYVEDEKNKESTKLQVAYPRMKVLENITACQGNLFTEEKSKKKINVVPKDKNSSTGNSKTFWSDKGPHEGELSVCGDFLGLTHFDTSNNKITGRKNSKIGVCQQALNMRKVQQPANKIYHFYGDSTEGSRKIKFLNKDGEEEKFDSKENYNNEFPECNCVNSMYVMDPTVVDKSDGKIGESELGALQQVNDKSCANAIGNSYVGVLNSQNINLCVNIAQDIRALATEGSKINIQQSCGNEPETDNSAKANDMKKEDNNTQKEVEEKKATEEANARAAELEKVKGKLAEKQAIDEASSNEVPKATTEPVTEPVTEPATEPTTAPTTEPATVPTPPPQSNNMLYIGAGVGLVVVILLVVMMGGKKQTVEYDDEEEE